MRHQDGTFDQRLGELNESLLAVGGGAALIAVIGIAGVFLAAARARHGYKDPCPNCASGRVRPSWPKFRDNLLAGLAIGPFRCEACKKRFYARTAPNA